jgi:hypothetical protein
VDIACGYYALFYPLMIFALGIAAVPWLRWRFSLSTLLIGMTVLAVVLGLLAWAMR